MPNQILKKYIFINKNKSKCTESHIVMLLPLARFYLNKQIIPFALCIS